MVAGTRTGWTFNTSSGVNTSVGPLLVSLSRGEGNIVLNSPDDSPVKFHFESIAAGIGIGAPVSITASTEDFPSSGSVYALKKPMLTADDFTGLASIGDVSIGTGIPAYSGTALFMGMRVPAELRDVVATVNTASSRAISVDTILAPGKYVAGKMLGTSSVGEFMGSITNDVLKNIHLPALIQTANALVLMKSMSVGFSLGAGVSGGLAYVKTNYSAPPVIDLHSEEPIYVPIHLAPNDNSVITLPANLLFDFNDSRIKDTAATTQALGDVAKIIKDRQAQYRTYVTGYTCTIGEHTAHGRRHNLILSQNRAGAVLKWLNSQPGIKAEDITAQGRGPADPVASNATKDGRTMNRRVEFVFLRKPNM